jgi:MoxR-like ATPase
MHNDNNNNNQPQSRAQIETAGKILTRAENQLNNILLGRHDLHRMVLTAILSRGHILLEGLPGLGKTALVKALSQIMQLDFNRVQFTPDLMPGDILGTHILQQNSKGEREMQFTPGPIFTNILLADEINRASPKTQSAMLETMQEHCVTLMGTTRNVPEPFFVLATQNPIELEGTYPLPEAQLDRFLFKLVVQNLDTEVMTKIITTRQHGHPPTPTDTISAKELDMLFKTVDAILLPKPVAHYIARLVHASHPTTPEAPDNVNDYVAYGASPRAAISIATAARAQALFNMRPTVGFEDVQSVTRSVLNHRIVTNYKARFDNVSTFDIINSILEKLDEAGLDLPNSITLQ